MKIKSDFVTNSSSTSYLVYTPESFKIDSFISLIKESEIKELSEELELTIEEYIGGLTIQVEEIKKHGNIEQYDNPYYYMLTNLFEKLELSITDWNTPSDCGIIINVGSRNIQDRIDIIQSGGWGIKHGGWGIK